MEEKELGGEEQVVLKGKEQMKGYGSKQWRNSQTMKKQPEGMRKWKRQEAVRERGVDKAFW